MIMRNIAHEPKQRYETDTTFDINKFLIDESVEIIEWETKHFPDGTLRYQYRTDEDKSLNCRVPYGVGIDESGMLYVKRSFSCHVLTGDNACEYCLATRERKRQYDFSDRIDNINGATGLYVLVTSNANEQRRVAQNCKYHGYDYLAVPNGNEFEKVVIVNGPVKDSVPLSREEAKRRLSKCAPVMFNDRSVRVSGNLGREELAVDKRENEDIINLSIRYILYTSDKKPTGVEIAIANARMIGKLSFASDGITKENIQSLVSEREDVSISVLKSMGFSCKLSSPKIEKFNFTALKNRWISINRQKCTVGGAMSSLDEITRTVIERAVHIQNERLLAVDFDGSVASATNWYK